MESKVLLFNDKDAKVGETYMRRARQLVNQQRAAWVDESHSAIRFMPDAELSFDTPDTEDTKPSGHSLKALAEKNLREKKKFIYLTILFAGCSFLSLLFAESTGDYTFFMFTFGICIGAYFVYAWNFIRTYVKGYRPIDRAERYSRDLAKEMDRLKRIGYTE